MKSKQQSKISKDMVYLSHMAICCRKWLLELQHHSNKTSHGFVHGLWLWPTWWEFSSALECTQTLKICQNGDRDKRLKCLKIDSDSQKCAPCPVWANDLKYLCRGKILPYKHERSLWVIWWPGILLTRRWFNAIGLRNCVGNSRYCDKTAGASFGPLRGTYMVFSLSLPALVPSCPTPPHLGVKPRPSLQKSWEQVLLLVTALSLWNQLIIFSLFVACLLGL